MIKVLVVDDQTLVRSGFRLILDAQPDITVIGEAANGQEALALAERTAPDVVLMDLRMPQMDGIEATRRLLAQPAPPRVLVLTTFDLDEHVYDAMKAGASGFLLKDVRPEQLADAVRAVATGDTLLAPTLTRRLVERFVATARPGAGPAVLDVLTERERDVLRLIAAGMTNNEIAQQLVVSEATVKTHVNRLLGKLSLRDRTQAVVLAYETGLVRPQD